MVKRLKPRDGSAFTPLPRAERDVVAGLARLGSATAREIRESMEAFRPMAHASVVTLLGRLEAKGLVTKAKGPVGKAFVYSPSRDRGHPFRSVVKDLLDRVFGGSGLALVTSLFETKPPTSEEIDELERLLGDLRRKTRSGKGRR